MDADKQGPHLSEHTAIDKSRRLQILLIEDSEDDALLIVRQLRQDGLSVEHRRVDSETDMRLALEEADWDVVLCDYGLPKFGPIGALDVMAQSKLNVPFIVVSGQLREDQLVDLMHAGAHDVVVKSNLSRLAPAIERERREAARRQDRRLLEAGLQGLAAQSQSATYLKDTNGRFVFVNAIFKEWFGTDGTEFVGKTAAEVFPEAVANVSETLDRKVLTDPLAQTDYELNASLGRHGDKRVAIRRFVITGDDGEILGIGGINTIIADEPPSDKG